MQANNIIGDKLVENQAEFSDPFFSKIPLAKRPEPLKMPDGSERDYNFPTLYDQTQCLQVAFLCDYQAAKAMLPEGLKPLNMLNGRALIIIAAYSYGRVLNVAPYNEIAVTIPVLLESAVSVPVLPLLIKGYKKFGYYVLDMPVTSLENKIRGVDIWGLPKTVNDIKLEKSDSRIKVDVNDESGNAYISLDLPISGKQQTLDLGSVIYSHLKGQMAASENQAVGDFSVNKNMGLLLQSRKNAMSLADSPFITLGSCAKADQLRRLKMQGEPLLIRYSDHLKASFTLPSYL